MSTGSQEKIKCPICATSFEYWVQHSYTTFGCNLDFKPYGAAVIPNPIAKCPKCFFVFDKKLFSKNEIEIIKKKIKKNNIFEQDPNMPNYFYLAKEFEMLNKNIDTIIYYYTSAIWEKPKYNILKKITNILFSYYENIDETNNNFYIYKLIKLDYLRRLRRSKKALYLIQSLYNKNNFPIEYKVVLDLQKELIHKHDTNEHKMPNIETGKEED